MASFLDNIFPSSPDDPRYAANMALFAGMMKGDFGGGAQAFADVLQRGKAQQLQSQLGQLNLQKGQLEVNDLQRKLADDQAARDIIREESTRRAIGTTPQGSLGSGSYGIAEPPQTGATMGASGAPAQPTAGTPASSRNNVWQLYQRMGDALAAKGLTAQSQSYYQLAEKFRPKYGTEPRVMTDPATGKLVQVLVSEDGSTNVLPFGVKPNMKLQDLGGRVVAVDENAVGNGQTFDKTMTPGETATDQRARQQMAQTERHFQANFNTPQYMQTDAGVVALPKRIGAGPIVGQTVTGPDGQPLTSPLKQIPPAQNGAIIENSKAIQNIDSAIAAIRNNPAAMGGFNYLGDAVRQRTDPSGVPVRAQVANIAGQKFHDLSGAAVSVGEAARLRPFIPSDTDSPQAAIEKLMNLRREYASINDMLSQTYSREQGYRPSPVQPSGPSGFRVIGVEKQ